MVLRLFFAHTASEHGGVTHEGVTLHDASFAHKALGTGFGAVMWFWVFYRFYKDGDVLLYGHAPHFEHDDHDEHHMRNHPLSGSLLIPPLYSWSMACQVMWAELL